MKYLVDTHILLWSSIDPEQLSKNVSQTLLDENNDIYYSPINLWEISIKYSLKKLELKGITPNDFFEELNDSYYLCKEIENINLITNYKLPIYHKDPFDRFLIWEAIQNDFVFISVDEKMEAYKSEGLKVIY
jgi:PIN domain nuclease of toxin-antitoxin system